MNGLDELVEAVGRRYGLSQAQIRYGSGRRVRDARAAIFYAGVQRGYSTTEVGACVGVDHATVLLGLERMESLLAALVSDGWA